MGNPILDMLDQQNNSAIPQQNNSLPTSLDDPRMNETKQYVQTHGGDPKAAFFQLCNEKMRNPSDIINTLLNR